MVIILLANGFEEVEALAPLDIMHRGGLPVKTVGIGGKTITGAHGITVEADLTPGEVDESKIDMLLLPGGMPGTTNLEQSPVTHSYIDAVMKNGGHLAAICAAPSILGHRGLLRGKSAICFPGFESALEGATICCGSPVVTDGKITTARDFRAAYALGDELTAIYKKMKGIKDTPVAKGDESDAAFVVRTINETFSGFDIDAAVRSYVTGPRINSYELRLGEKTKPNKVQSVFADLSLNLGREGVRMVCPNANGTITVEVPRRDPEVVRWEALAEADSFKAIPSKTAFVYGALTTGEPLYGDVTRLPHLIVSGATGMGKSVFFNGLLASIITRTTPSECRLLLIDPKKVEFRMFESCPHRLCPVITDAWDAAGALAWAVEEMERRYGILEKAETRNIDCYNDLVKQKPDLGEPMYRIIIAIDELNDLMMICKNPVEDLIMRIAQKARSAGIHLIIGTQRPDVKVLTGVIKANIPSRVCFKVASAVDSRTVLDSQGANNLLNRGDMLVKPADKPLPIRVQCAFISDGEIEDIVAADEKNYPLTDMDGAATSGIIAAIQRVKAEHCKPPREAREEAYIPVSDKIFIDAVNLVLTEDAASITLLQRKLSVGYSRAAYYISVMEDLKIISNGRGSRARQVLISADEWTDMLASLSAQDGAVGDDESREESSEDGKQTSDSYLSDKVFIQAGFVAVRAGKISTSLLQRKLQIGFGHAARIIDSLEDIGVISAPNGQKPRDVLMTEAEWIEFLEAHGITVDDE
ncbi:MAG: DJ-1/PfpI family protein [Clostridia bacterium]|nr:DJ-1/PfpI family protein [Clostridia bacterium]